MTIKNGKVTFWTEEGHDDYYSQRNNEIIWPDHSKFPNSQLSVDWKSTCNVTAYIAALAIAGWNFPSGKYKQPEDNLADFILSSTEIDSLYQKQCPAMWRSYVRALNGQCSKQELKNVFTKVELHEYLSKGANLWLGSTASTFSTNVNFVKALWRYLVYDNLPMVISTNFGGFGHIVTVVGATWNEADYEKGDKQFYDSGKKEYPEIEPESILIDDPWGRVQTKDGPRQNTYLAGGGGSGNNVTIPWDFVVEHVKPLGSRSCKWVHSFKHGMATV